jgi:3-oxoacyl-[acyl-carrier protein] reductase
LKGFGGKVIVVTGGGSGIGKEISYRLAMEGASVVVADINFKKAKLVERNIISRGLKSMALETDVTSEESVKRMVEATIKRFKQINVLVNNAGIYPLQSWEKVTVEEWDKVMIVNLRSIFVCSKAVFYYMKRQKKGKIINISSSTFWLGSKGLLPYVASKGGVIGFTRALAREVGDFGITVNAVTAGLTMTKKAKEIFGQERIEQVIQQQCIKKPLAPQKIVGAVIYLCSEDSDFITGEIINIDGGRTMH